MENQKNRFQWFVITVVGGREADVCNRLMEKMRNFGYGDKVAEVRVFWRKKVTEEIFNKNDPKMPKNLNNTKTVKWEHLPDGRYIRYKTKTVNWFPGYVFVNIEYSQEIWYAIRNTVDVMGFVGSTGKGALPIPCDISEYTKIAEETAKREYTAKIEAKAEETKPEAKPEVKHEEVKPAKPVLLESPFPIGAIVEILTGSFAGEKAKVVDIDLEKQSVIVEYEFFGRINTFPVAFDEAKLAE